MLRTTTILTLLLLTLAVPTVPADTGQGATTGMNLGFVQVGLWDAWTFDHLGGTATIELSWAPSLFPGADYDLRVYAPNALADGFLSDNELVAESATRSFAPHTETISMTLPSAKWVVAVVPYQTQLETYTLDADPGWLNFAAIAPGITGTL